MRLPLFVSLALLSSIAFADCGGGIAFIKTDKVSIDIGDDGCDADTKTMIHFSVKGKNGKFGKEVGVPFLSECSPTKDGFKCRPNGKTPLAGATYKRIEFGRSNSGCRNEGDLGSKYICIRGCENPRVSGEDQVIPEYLNGEDTSC